MKKLIIISAVISAAFLALFFVLIRNERCNTAVINLRGRVSTSDDGSTYDDEESYYAVSSARIAGEIDKLKDRSNIRALILDVDSEGGSVVAAEEIFNALERLTIPTVALVRDGAFSAAYTAMSAADKIFLQRSSQVGAIGVTASYLANYEKNAKEGISFQSLTSAKFKDLLDPNKPLTEEEKKLLQGIINDMHENVVTTIAQGRGMSVDEARSLADGSIYVGEKAIEKKLADSIGGMKEAKEYLQTVAGTEVKLCVAF